MKMLRLAFFIATVALLSSCSKEQDQTTEQEISTTQLSEKIITYVDNNFPDAYIYSAVRLSNSDASTIVILNTTESLAFNASDDFMGDGALFHPGNHHHGQGPGQGHGHGHGGFSHGGGNGHCHGFQHGDFNAIPVDSLPPSISGYITSNYPGYQIVHAEHDSLCSTGEVIEVMAFISGAPPIKLIFDQAGNFLMSASRIAYSATPLAVQNSISNAYPGYTPRPRSTQFTLANSQVQYGVFLFNGSDHKRIIIADDGTVICEQ